jgi:hypothetical protein
LVGGHAKPALRRAARLGDGWIAAGGKIEEYKAMIDQINAFRKEYGRDHLPFQIQAMSHDSFSVDGLMQLHAIGVTEVIIAFRDVYGQEADDKSVEEKTQMINWYADNMIKPFREQVAAA